MKIGDKVYFLFINDNDGNQFYGPVSLNNVEILSGNIINVHHNIEMESEKVIENEIILEIKCSRDSDIAYFMNKEDVFKSEFDLVENLMQKICPDKSVNGLLKKLNNILQEQNKRLDFFS